MSVVLTMEGVVRYVPTVSAPSSAPVMQGSFWIVIAGIAMVNTLHFSLLCHLKSYSDTDVNECNTGNGGCGQSCFNFDGSFMCFCNAGFVLASDNLNCNGKSTLPSQCCAHR